MLALTDSQLGRLFIAATAVPPQDRSRWLHDIAERLDPPPRRVLRDPANAPKPLADMRPEHRVRARPGGPKPPAEATPRK